MRMLGFWEAREFFFLFKVSQTTMAMVFRIFQHMYYTSFWAQLTHPVQGEDPGGGFVGWHEDAASVRADGQLG